jgi:hypothetical protein
MQSALSGCFGFVLGVFVGGAIGVGAGLLWTHVFQTSCFEGYCGMLVFFSFMPIGAILGGIAGAVLLVALANQTSRPPATVAASDAANQSHDQ